MAFIINEGFLNIVWLHREYYRHWWLKEGDAESGLRLRRVWCPSLVLEGRWYQLPGYRLSLLFYPRGLGMTKVVFLRNWMSLNEVCHRYLSWVHGHRRVYRLFWGFRWKVSWGVEANCGWWVRERNRCSRSWRGCVFLDTDRSCFEIETLILCLIRQL